MGVDERNLQIIDVDITLENCSLTIVILNLLVYGTKEYSIKVIIEEYHDNPVREH